MLTAAGLVAGCLAGLWLLTWVVQIAAYAMFAMAFVAVMALRLLAGVALLLVAAGTAWLGPPALRAKMRAALRSGWEQRRPAT